MSGMKVFFIRHGEAMDDVEDCYGGWADHELSPVGAKGANKVAQKLRKRKVRAELILSSPLKRAVQTAKIIGEALEIPVENFVYLKERNTYGLLSGENKDEAKEKYPDLVEAYEKGENVLGYEDYHLFLKRVKVLMGKFTFFAPKTLICVTHGKLLAALFKDILGREAKKFHDNCLVEVEISKKGNLALISTDGIDF